MHSFNDRLLISFLFNVYTQFLLALLGGGGKIKYSLISEWHYRTCCGIIKFKGCLSSDNEKVLSRVIQGRNVKGV